MVQETFRNLLDLGAEFPVDGSQFDRLLADGVLLHAGSLESGVIATPGHTPACVPYRIGDASVHDKLYTLPDADPGAGEGRGLSARWVARDGSSRDLL